MSNVLSGISPAVSDDVSDKISAGNGTAISGATGAKNKNLEAIAFKRHLTSMESRLELPVKDFRRTGRKLSHINAGIYS